MVKTNKDLGLLWLRVLMGLAMASHGYAKVFGGQVKFLIEGLPNMGFPMPVVFAWLAALSEFVGGLFIAIGLFTRVSSLFVFVTMCVAFFIAHAHDPFQVKELAYLYGAVAGAFIFTGAGRYSIDGRCCKSHTE
jgi:putative oxidoreductase